MSAKNDEEIKTDSSDSSDESYNLSLGDLNKGLEESIVGTIFVNEEFRIKSFVSSVSELINLSSFDKDLEINDFARQLKYELVTHDIKQVFKERNIIKKEVQGENGRWYMLELRPHVTKDENNGVVITFVDVTGLKKTEKKLAENLDKIKKLQRQIIKNDVSERWRIGRYLHDDLGQSLVAAKILVERALKSENVDKDDLHQLLDIISQGLDDTRDLSHEVVPVEIEEKGISHAFNNIARQVKKMHNINCELAYDNTVYVLKNIEIATHLYRIAQEAAKNAAVHGGAETIRITFKSDDDYLYLSIEDDGTGFPDSEKAGEGIGISIMRHRIDLLGGTFEMNGTSDMGDTGATITCRIPRGTGTTEATKNRSDLHDLI